jgi:hypothetical protein
VQKIGTTEWRQRKTEISQAQTDEKSQHPASLALDKSLMLPTGYLETCPEWLRTMFPLSRERTRWFIYSVLKHG